MLHDCQVTTAIAVLQVRASWMGEVPEKSYKPLHRDSVSSVDSGANHILHQPLVTPSIFDQSILNWPSLQVCISVIDTRETSVRVQLSMMITVVGAKQDISASCPVELRCPCEN